jgi:hypothetical protein
MNNQLISVSVLFDWDEYSACLSDIKIKRVDGRRCFLASFQNLLSTKLQSDFQVNCLLRGANNNYIKANYNSSKPYWTGTYFCSRYDIGCTIKYSCCIKPKPVPNQPVMVNVMFNGKANHSLTTCPKWLVGEKRQLFTLAVIAKGVTNVHNELVIEKEKDTVDPGWPGYCNFNLKLYAELISFSITRSVSHNWVLQ